MHKTQEIVISTLCNQDLDIQLSSINSSTIVEYFKNNKLSFLDVDFRNNKPWIKELFKKEIFVKEIKNERNLLESWKRDFLTIKDVWDKNGIEYLFHKSVGSFPYQSDNLDIMVKPKDFNNAGNLLKELGYINLRNIQEAHKEFYRKFNGIKVVGPIHLHERVCWVVPFEDNKSLWKNKIQSPDDALVHYPGYEDCILINVAHCFLEDHLIKLKDILYIKKCIDAEVINWDYIINVSTMMHWKASLFTGLIIIQHLSEKILGESIIPTNVINEATIYVNKRFWIKKTIDKLLKRDKLLPFKIPHLWTRLHSSLREFNDPLFGSKPVRIYQITSGLIDRLIHLKLKIHNQPGMIISFSGLDGSGKTMHIDAIRLAFHKCEIKTKYIWSRTGSLKFIKFLSKTWRRKSPRNNFIDGNNKAHNFRKNKYVVSLWKMINILELLILYGIYLRFFYLLNRVIICDRYFIDTIVDLESFNQQGNINRFIYRIYKILIPIPHLALYIDTDPSIIRKRAINDILENIDYNQILYQQLVSKHDIITVDNSQDFDEVSTRLISMILSRYFEKYPDKYHDYKVISFKYK